MQYRRFIDRDDKTELMEASEGFNPRQHGTSIKRLGLYFMAVLFITIMLLNHLISKFLFTPDGNAPTLDEVIVVLGGTVFFAIVVGVVALMLIIKVRKNITATEFQNLIFASCMRVDSDFCLVLHKDRKGIYCDYKFNTLFEPFVVHSDDPFHQLLASQGFRKGDEKKLLDALKDGRQAQFTFSLKHPEGKAKKIKLRLDPIERPGGFFLLRGYLQK